jgi:glyoxalase family protein
VPTETGLAFWNSRFDALGIDYDAPRERYGRHVLTFRDPEGQRLALISDDDSAPIPVGVPWAHEGVPLEHAITGLSAISTTTARPHATLPVLTDIMGFRITDEIAEESDPSITTYVLETGEGGPNALVYLHTHADAKPASLGRGGVHHVAFRTRDAEHHAEWREYIGSRGMNITPEIDRFYFLAAYFREPGGVLFEISSDGPGFQVDQAQDELGVEVALPPFLMQHREQIIELLHPLDTSLERTSKDAATRIGATP